MTGVAPKLVCGALLLLSTSAGAQSLRAARADARLGKVDAAIADLRSVPPTAESHALLCSLQTSIEQRDAAVAECEAAAAAAPSNSEYALQLARAYGDKADHSGMLTGMRMVGKIRGSFERAVELDGNSVEALSDLGQFYVDAPGAVGGGTDKARALVTRLQTLSPARAHRLSAMIAAKAKDEASAEQEFKAELSVARTAEAYVDLANFYRARKRFDEAADNARLAIQRDSAHGPDTLDAVNVLIELKRDAKAVQAALRAYLATPQATVASYAKAHTLLGDSLQADGDTAGAQKEFAAALALAHEYEPARKRVAR